MKNKFYVLLVGLALYSPCIAQQKKLSFSSQIYGGIVVGESDNSPQVQMINGVKWKKWFGGIGAGIDWYYIRSVPVFLSVNKSFFQKDKRSLFLSADAGYNFEWERKYYRDFPPYDTEKKGGAYWGTGVGYRFGVGKSDNAVLFQLGYSYKKLTETQTYVNPCLIGPCPEYTERLDYKLRRFSIKLGWGF